MVCVCSTCHCIVILYTKQPVDIGPNLGMAFSILTFSQNWTCTNDVCYTFCLFIKSLHSGVLLVLSIEYLIALTCRASSWAACKRLSVSHLSSPHFIHSHLFLSSVLSVSLKNWMWRAFSFHSIRCCFLLSCLFWTFVNFSSFSSVVAAMISFSLQLKAYSAKFSLSSLT